MSKVTFYETIDVTCHTHTQIYYLDTSQFFPSTNDDEDDDDDEEDTNDNKLLFFVKELFTCFLNRFYTIICVIF